MRLWAVFGWHSLAGHYAEWPVKTRLYTSVGEARKAAALAEKRSRKYKYFACYIGRLPLRPEIRKLIV